MRAEQHWLGPEAFTTWQHDRQRRGLSSPATLDVVLLTHPRDEHDLPQLYPWTADLTLADRRAFTHHLQPVFGEVIETPSLAIGIIFLPRFADELMHPLTRRACRQFLEGPGMQAVIATGARVLCLGGLLGALANYGRRLAAVAAEHDLVVTTGHAMTATTVLETCLRASHELEVDLGGSRLALLGVGSVGAGFGQLLAGQPARPAELVLIDKPDRVARVEVLADDLARAGLAVSIELTTRQGQLQPDSACYDAGFVVSAVSTPDVIDVERVAPRTILVDDSQPNCWSREAAWRRIRRLADIAPCEAGLVNVGTLGFRSAFPFPIAEMDGSHASPIAWCCLAEGISLALDPSLPPTVGEPTRSGLERHHAAFLARGFTTGRLQCGRSFLPVDDLRASFAGLGWGLRRGPAVVAPYAATTDHGWRSSGEPKVARAALSSAARPCEPLVQEGVDTAAGLRSSEEVALPVLAAEVA